jgi:hypothetical protein
MFHVVSLKNQYKILGIEKFHELKYSAVLSLHDLHFKRGKVKAVPLQAWGGPEDSRKLRFPDFLTMAQDGGKFVSTGRIYPQEILLVLISVSS